MPNIISENLAKAEVLRSIRARSQARLGQPSIALASQMRNVYCWPIAPVKAVQRNVGSWGVDGTQPGPVLKDVRDPERKWQHWRYTSIHVAGFRTMISLRPVRLDAPNWCTNDSDIELTL